MKKLIYADELIHKLLTAIECGKRNDMPVHELEAVLADVRRMKAVDAAPVVHGHWVQADLDHNYVTCSNCKELNRNDRLAFIPDYAKGMHYCMICGAKMDDSTQSNDSNTLDALGEKVTE